MVMLSIRTGWPRQEILGLTPSEAKIVDEELLSVDEIAESRLLEAVHNPKGYIERRKARQVKHKPGEGWNRLKAWHRADLRQKNPKAAEGLELIDAARRYLESKRGRA